MALLAGPPAATLAAAAAGGHAAPVAAAATLGVLGTVLLAQARQPAPGRGVLLEAS